jgi:phosphopantothenoylcysteine synthetase/decarboxylase
MKVIVTAGPSFEPIDEVRRLTNFSTGELGVSLSNALARAGCEVFCLKGVGATYPGGLERCHHVPFTTNDELLELFTKLSREQDIGAIFHAAALCDFKVTRVEDAAGQEQRSAKIDSRIQALTLVLEPARKVISELRPLFPRAAIVGWKYELAGRREQALAKAWRQLRENRTEACVLNGRAYGPGFAFCTLPDRVRELRDKAALVGFLVNWLEELKLP